MSKYLRKLQQTKAEKFAESVALQNKAKDEERNLTAEEQTAYTAAKTEMETLAHRIELEQERIEMEKAQAVVQVKDDAHIQVEENVLKDPKRGFKTVGEFAKSVRVARIRPDAVDSRLRIQATAPTTFGSEISGADGGFLVPPEFSQNIFTLSLQEDSLLPYTDNYEVAGNSMVFPKDETTPWATDGMRAYWQSEGSAGIATKPKLGNNTLNLHKLMALVPVSDELMEDGPALGQYITNKASDSIRYKTNEAFLFGTGPGTPLGALAGPAAVTIAKDSGQGTGTVSLSNLTNMMGAMPSGSSYNKAIWLMSPSCLSPLMNLTLGNYPIYLPVGGGQGGAQINAFGRLLGRPAFISQHANTFGSQGDFMLLDLSYYRTITKASGVETATSMHLYFDSDVTAFRVLFRVDGQPTIVSPIKPAKSAQNLSPFLQLAARP